MYKVVKRAEQTYRQVETQPIPVLKPMLAADVAPVVEQVDLAALEDEARQVCAALRQAAEQEAASIIDKAKKEAEQLQQAAEQRGYETGLERASAKMEAEFAQWQATEQSALSQLAVSIEQDRQEKVKSLVPFVGAFAMEAVKRLLHRELALEPVHVGAMVEELLTYVLHSTSVQLRVHPDDYQAARQAHPRWQAMKYGDWHIAIVPDGTLSPGDCEIYADTGRIDAKLTTRLEELQFALDDLLRQQGEASSGAESESLD